MAASRSLIASETPAYAPGNTAATPAGSLRENPERRLVSLNFASWNLIGGWLARLDGLRRAA